MKRIDWFYFYEDEYAQHIGVEWGALHYRPLKRFPDRDYWHSFFVQFCVCGYKLQLHVNTHRAPYRNWDEYVAWLKAARKRS